MPAFFRVLEDAMKLNTESLAATAALTAASIFTVCSALLALFPEFVRWVWSNAWHPYSGRADMSLSWTSYVLGLCFWLVAPFVVFALSGWIYNRMTQRRRYYISFPSVDV